MNIGQQLKSARNKKKLTQEQLSEQIGISRQSISNWENSKSYPDIESLIKLSNIYDLSLDVLLKGDDRMIKDIVKKTDINKNNRFLALIYSAWMILFMTLSMISNIIELPKLENLLINIAILIIVFCAVMIQLIKSKKSLPQEQRSNILSMIIIAIFYIIALFLIAQIIPYLTTLIWQQNAIRLFAALLLAIPCMILYEKIKYVESEK